MKKILVKSIVFFFIIGIPVYVVSRLTKPQPRDIAISTSSREISSATDTPFVFIGSSRVQMGVDPSIISAAGGRPVYNMGLAAGTFLANCIVAKHLMESKNPKVLFIELSEMRPEVPGYLLRYQDQLDLDVVKEANHFHSGQGARMQLVNSERLVNKYYSDKIFINSELKQLVSGNSSAINEPFGFRPAVGNRCSFTDSFLDPSDFRRYTNTEAVREYTGYISRLQQLARVSGTRLIFFLPVTFSSVREKSILLPVFNALPVADRLDYTNEFLYTIRQSRYLLNANHLNRSGATVWSQWLGTRL